MKSLFAVIENMLLPRNHEMHTALPFARSALVELQAAGDALARPGQTASSQAVQRWTEARRRAQLFVTEVQP